MLVFTFGKLFPAGFYGGSQLTIEKFMTTSEMEGFTLDIDRVDYALTLAMKTSHYAELLGEAWWLLCDIHSQFCINTKRFAAYSLPGLGFLEKPEYLDKVFDVFVKTDPNSECVQKQPSQCGCGIEEISLSGKIAGTFGSSSVGLCSPDANPIQFSFGTEMIWARDETDCVVKYQQAGVVSSLTLALNLFLQVDIVRQMSLSDSFIGLPNLFRLRVRVPVAPPQQPLNKNIDQLKKLQTAATKESLETFTKKIVTPGQMPSAKQLDTSLVNWVKKTFQPVFKHIEDRQSLLAQTPVYTEVFAPMAAGASKVMENALVGVGKFREGCFGDSFVRAFCRVKRMAVDEPRNPHPFARRCSTL